MLEGSAERGHAALKIHLRNQLLRSRNSADVCSFTTPWADGVVVGVLVIKHCILAP